MILNNAKLVTGNKAPLGLINKHRSTDIERGKNATPGKLHPAWLRNVVMTVSRLQSNPCSGGQVSQGITGMCMHNHFWHSCCTRSKEPEQVLVFLCFCSI